MSALPRRHRRFDGGYEPTIRSMIILIEAAFGGAADVSTSFNIGDSVAAECCRIIAVERPGETLGRMRR